MNRTILIALTAFLSLGIAACDDGPSDTAEPSDSDAAELDAEAEEPRGTLTFAFQPQENPDGLALDTERFAEFIGQQTGFEVEIFLPTNYSAVVEALRSDNADVAYFSGLPYMMAHKMADAELLVVEEREGNPFYYSQWYTLKDSGIDDLSDLEGHSIAFTSPTSTSGYLFPLAEVIDQGLLDKKGDPRDFFGDVVFAGGYQQALLSLVNGRVDAAAASDYSLQQYLSDDERDNIKVITEQGPVPTHGLAVRGGLDDEVVEDIRQALLMLNEEEYSDLLESVYGAEKLVVQDHDTHVDALQHAYELVDFDEDI